MNILPKKSWHVYSTENRERVLKDERKHAIQVEKEHETQKRRENHRTIHTLRQMTSSTSQPPLLEQQSSYLPEHSQEMMNKGNKQKRFVLFEPDKGLQGDTYFTESHYSQYKRLKAENKLNTNFSSLLKSKDKSSFDPYTLSDFRVGRSGQRNQSKPVSQKIQPSSIPFADEIILSKEDPLLKIKNRPKKTPVRPTPFKFIHSRKS